MALSVVDLYQKILPKTNCGDCGHPTCLAFASMVVSEKLPLKRCPHIEAALLARAQTELDRQHADEKWTKRDLAADALQWAKKRAASMTLDDLSGRIGGKLSAKRAGRCLVLPYFNGHILIGAGKITTPDGAELNHWEQVFIYNHMAQGGRALPTGRWKGLEQIPNTISKMKSMKAHVEAPLVSRFAGKTETLREAAAAIGGIDRSDQFSGTDGAYYFQALPRLPVMLLFWDQDPADGFEAQVKLMFDETIVEHLDVESIMFLSERLKQLLCGEKDFFEG